MARSQYEIVDATDLVTTKDNHHHQHQYTNGDTFRAEKGSASGHGNAGRPGSVATQHLITNVLEFVSHRPALRLIVMAGGMLVLAFSIYSLYRLQRRKTPW